MNEEQIRQAKRALLIISEVFHEVFNELRDKVVEMYEYIKTLRHQKRVNDFNWHIPIKMKLPEAPFIIKHNIQFARSNL